MGKAAIVVDRLHIGLHGSTSDIVNDVSFSIAPGEVLGLVGESGSGKTTVGLALLGHARRGAEIKGGSVRIGDIEVLELDPAERARLRGRVISYVPQDPASALNPALRIGTQLTEALDVHGIGGSGEERRAPPAGEMRRGAPSPAPPPLPPGPPAPPGGPPPPDRPPGGGAHRQPRSRGRRVAARARRRDVRGPDRRAGAGGRPVPRRRPPVPPPAGRRRAPPRGPPQPGRHPRPGALARAAAGGLLV